MRCAEFLPAALAQEPPLARVYSTVFFQIGECCEDLYTVGNVAVECLTLQRNNANSSVTDPDIAMNFDLEAGTRVSTRSRVKFCGALN